MSGRRRSLSLFEAHQLMPTRADTSTVRVQCVYKLGRVFAAAFSEIRASDMDIGSVGAEVVLSDTEKWMVSTATQTGEHTDLVQITVPLQQLMQRIESFKALKRQQIDQANRLEFYSTKHTDRGDGEGCARTDLIYVRRSPNSTNHIITQRIKNSSGPTPPPPSPLEELKQDLSPPVEWQPQSVVVKRGGLLHLPERIASLEHCTDLYSGGLAPKDLIQRVQNLEQRLLQLESSSPEYSLSLGHSKSQPGRTWQTH